MAISTMTASEPTLLYDHNCYQILTPLSFKHSSPALHAMLGRSSGKRTNTLTGASPLSTEGLTPASCFENFLSSRHRLTQEQAQTVRQAWTVREAQLLHLRLQQMPAPPLVEWVPQPALQGS